MALNLSNYSIDQNGARTAETSVKAFGGEESEFAKKMADIAKKQAQGYGAAAAPKKSAFEVAMERMALDQAKNAQANAGRGPVNPGHNRFAPADMAPIKYVGGPGIIPGATMDVMNMTYGSDRSSFRRAPPTPGTGWDILDTMNQKTLKLMGASRDPDAFVRLRRKLMDEAAKGGPYGPPASAARSPGEIRASEALQSKRPAAISAQSMPPGYR